MPSATDATDVRKDPKGSVLSRIIFGPAQRDSVVSAHPLEQIRARCVFYVSKPRAICSDLLWKVFGPLYASLPLFVAEVVYRTTVGHLKHDVTHYGKPSHLTVRCE